jgi:hypothetical protein
MFADDGRIVARDHDPHDWPKRMAARAGSISMLCPMNARTAERLGGVCWALASRGEVLTPAPIERSPWCSVERRPATTRLTRTYKRCQSIAGSASAAPRF